MVNAATGQARHWTFTVGSGRGAQALHGTGDVSLSADGRVVAFADRVLRTDAAPGSLVRRGRVVARNRDLGPIDDSRRPRGCPGRQDRVFRHVPDPAQQAGRENWQLRVFDVASGRTRLVRSIPGSQGTPPAVASDPTGRFL